MANSVLQDRQGPDWPLGFVKVATPGAPVNVMSVVDPTNVNAPETATEAGSNEYTPRAQRMMFMGYQPSAGAAAYIPNTGNVYIIRKPSSAGVGGKGDSGVLVKILAPAETWEIDAAALNRNTFSPYRYSLDADTANDGAMITLFIQ